MNRLFLYIICGCLFLFSCSLDKKIKIVPINDFDYSYLDSLSQINQDVSTLIHTKSSYLIFISDASCASCLSDFIHFVENKKNIDIPCIYVFNSLDFTLLDFYMNKYNVNQSFGKEDILIKYSSDLFHSMQSEQLAGNQILLIDKKDDRVKILPYSILVNPDAKLNLKTIFP